MEKLSIFVNINRITNYNKWISINLQEMIDNRQVGNVLNFLVGHKIDKNGIRNYYFLMYSMIWLMTKLITILNKQFY